MKSWGWLVVIALAPMGCESVLGLDAASKSDPAAPIDAGARADCEASCARDGGPADADDGRDTTRGEPSAADASDATDGVPDAGDVPVENVRDEGDGGDADGALDATDSGAEIEAVDGEPAGDAAADGSSSWLDDTAPALLATSATTLDVAVRESDGSLSYYRGSSGAYWQSSYVREVVGAAGTTLSQPAIDGPDTDHVDMVVVGAGGALVHYSRSPSLAWTSEIINFGLPGEVATSRPALVVRPNGQIDVAVQTSGNTLMYCVESPIINPWQCWVVAGSVVSAPSMSVRSSGEVDVAAVSATGEVFYVWGNPYLGCCYSPIGSPGTFMSRAALVVQDLDSADGSAGASIAYFAAEGPSNALLLYSAAPFTDWLPFTAAAQRTTFSSPSMALVPEGGVAIVALDSSGQAEYIAATATTASAPLTLPGMISGSPTIAVDGAGTAHVVARGSGAALHYAWAATGASWSDVSFGPP